MLLLSQQLILVVMFNSVTKSQGHISDAFHILFLKHFSDLQILLIINSSGIKNGIILLTLSYASEEMSFMSDARGVSWWNEESN